MASIPLNEVFGVSTDVPKYTYVDRQALDQRFTHYLESQKHIVVHGASKQGKSCLRKKNINPDSCIIVQCLPHMVNGDDVWVAALQAMGKYQVSKKTTTEEASQELAGEAGGQLKIPLVGGLSTKATGTAGNTSTQEIEEEVIQSNNHLSELGKVLRESGKRMVLEDFHYLPDATRHSVAFGLKALYEEKAYVVVVGIWSEQNLITYYNGDLTGRIEEINLTWNDADLGEVLLKGEGALNIEFAPGMKIQLIESSFQNVGLLQRLAEKVCMEAGVYNSQASKVVISNIDFLQKARTQIVSDIRQRYIRIAGVFVEGMRADSVLHLYARVYNELIDANNKELINGLSLTELLERVQKNAPAAVVIRQSDLTQSLERVERLQASRSITPLLVSYSRSVKKLFLNDREFLFYRKYSGDDSSELKVPLV